MRDPFRQESARARVGHGNVVWPAGADAEAYPCTKLSHRSVAGPRLSANSDLPVVAALPADPLRHAMSVGPVRDRCANVCGCAAPVWGHLAGFRHQGRHAGRLLASLSERQRAALRLTRPITEAFSGRGCRAWIRMLIQTPNPPRRRALSGSKLGRLGPKSERFPHKIRVGGHLQTQNQNVEHLTWQNCHTGRSRRRSAATLPLLAGSDDATIW